MRKKHSSLEIETPLFNVERMLYITGLSIPANLFVIYYSLSYLSYDCL